MEKSNLILFLKSLNKDELERFSDFIKSPFFNKKSTVVKMFGVIRIFSPGYNSPLLTKESVYKKVFKNLKYNDKVMRNTMSSLLKCGERFLEYIKLESSGVLRNTLLMDEALKRKLLHLFNDNLKTAQKLQDSSPKNDDYFYYNIKINEVLRASETIFNTKLENHPTPDIIEANVLGYFLIYYYKICISKLQQMRDYNYQSGNELFPVISKYYFDKNLPDSKIVSIYYNIVQMNIDPQAEKYFFDALELATRNSSRINVHEKYNMFICFSNYCLMKIPEGRERFIKALFDINKKIIEESLFSPRSKTSIVPLLFKNVVKGGAQAEEFEWTEKFIQNYFKKVSDDVREDMFNYCNAYVNFYKKEYDKSLEFISKIKYHNVYDKIDLNILLLQIYYEKNLTDELLYLADTFKHFLKNTDIVSEQIKIKYKTFVNIILKLYRIKISDEPILRYELTETEDFKIYEKKWLNAKIKEIKNSESIKG